MAESWNVNDECSCVFRMSIDDIDEEGSLGCENNQGGELHHKMGATSGPNPLHMWNLRASISIVYVDANDGANDVKALLHLNEQLSQTMSLRRACQTESFQILCGRPRLSSWTPSSLYVIHLNLLRQKAV